MNSYGPVSLAYEAIYKLLHYMNWFSNDAGDHTATATDVRVHGLDTDPMSNPNPNPNPNDVA
jgi:hypothetical protein